MSTTFRVAHHHRVEDTSTRPPSVEASGPGKRGLSMGSMGGTPAAAALALDVRERAAGNERACDPRERERERERAGDPRAGETLLLAGG